MMRIDIVRVDLANQQHCADLLAMLDHYAAHPMGQGQPLADDVRGRLIAGLRDTPTTLALLAYDDEKPIGVALCFRGFSSFKGRALLNIHDFAIHEEARGQGVGRQLMDAVFDTARELDCCRVTLEVSVANVPAQNLYLKCGFEPGDVESTSQWFWSKHLS